MKLLLFIFYRTPETKKNKNYQHFLTNLLNLHSTNVKTCTIA